MKEPYIDINAVFPDNGTTFGGPMLEETIHNVCTKKMRPNMCLWILTLLEVPTEADSGKQ